MHKLLPVIPVLLAAGACLSARGQWPAFGVYHAAGAIKCVPARGGAATVRAHSWLYTGDLLLLLDDNADIILFDPDTNYIHLHGKGKYTTADIRKTQRTHVQDNITVRYLSLLWEELFRPGSGAATQKETISSSTGGVSRGLSLVLAPADNYRTSLDGVVFRWQQVASARKYQLRLRDEDGRIRYDTLTADTRLDVRFAGRLPYGHTYRWSLDLVGDASIRNGDTGSIILIDEAAILPALPDLPPDSLGGLADSLRRIEQLEINGCTAAAGRLYRRLLTAYPHDSSLKDLYLAFCRRNER